MPTHRVCRNICACRNICMRVCEDTLVTPLQACTRTMKISRCVRRLRPVPSAQYRQRTTCNVIQLEGMLQVPAGPAGVPGASPGIPGHSEWSWQPLPSFKPPAQDLPRDVISCSSRTPKHTLKRRPSVPRVGRHSNWRDASHVAVRFRQPSVTFVCDVTTAPSGKGTEGSL